MDREKLHRLLRLGIEKGASDIHFQVGYLPLYRFHGELIELRYKVFTPADTEAISRMLLEGEGHPPELDFDDRDVAYELPGEGRFRVNISRQRRCYSVVLRVIPPEIRGFDSLNLPNGLRDLAQLRRGYVLVTGSTGMGKSTTLAALIHEVNRTRKLKIVTIEDPVEFVFRHDKSIITQREVGTDTTSFPEALRAALRQDPDVIMVGEMRDLGTVDTSLKASETGHLVFSSIHTSDVVSTVNRIVSFFPPEEQPQVRARLAENLQAIVSLRLLQTKKGNGRVPAVEIMRSTRSIQECIKDPARTSEILEFMARGESMQTFDQHLLDLLRASKVSLETALAAATNPTDFKTRLALEGVEVDAPGDEEPMVGPLEIDSDERF
jgi:twitching motility protein PilT